MNPSYLGVLRQRTDGLQMRYIAVRPGLVFSYGRVRGSSMIPKPSGCPTLANWATLRFRKGDQKGTACHGNSRITADSDWTRLVASDADTYYYSVCTVEQVTVKRELVL